MITFGSGIPIGSLLRPMAGRVLQILNEVKPYYKQDRDTKDELIVNEPAAEPIKQTEEYKVKSGDVLGIIARNNGITVNDVLALNPDIKDPSKIRVGQTIILPKIEKEEYTIKAGDTLSKIAKEHNITVNKLLKQNPHISNPNVISEGQILYFNKPKEGQWKNLNDVRQSEQDLTSEQAIHNAQHDGNYVVINKNRKRGTVFNQNGIAIYSFPISTGESNQDYNTITYVDSKGNIVSNKGNMSTPAGITTVTGTGTYHGYPSFTRGRVNSQMSSSNDEIASSFHYGNLICGSNGCVRMNGNTLNALTKYIEPGTMVYTLPQQEGSRFVLKDGNLSFVADNPYGEEGNYWDDYNVTVNKTYQPLKIELNKNYSPNSWWESKVNSYSNAITSNKQQLMQELNLDSATYNTLARLAMGIAQQETQFGTSLRKLAKDVAGNDTISAVKRLLGRNSYNSHGITQIKLSGDNNELQELYNKHNITDSVLDDPEFAAVATMLRLAHIYNSEIKGRQFVDANGNPMNLEDVILYKWQGKNKMLQNGTATPDLNSYLRNVKDYSNWFNYYIKQN